VRRLWLLALAASGCATAVRAGDYYATPLLRPASPRARLEARWRVQPAPAGCATVGAPIVFLPALGLTQHTWAGVTAALAACAPRVLVDPPGVGEAPPAQPFDEEAVLQALADVVDAVAPDGRVVLAGHSLGGAVATRLAARLGERVQALVLVAAAVAPFKLDLWERLLLRFPSVWPPDLHLVGASFAVRFGLRHVSGGGERLTPLDVALMAADFSDHRRRATVMQYYRTFLDREEVERTEAALRQLRVPTLLVWGRDDKILPLEVLWDAERDLSGTRTITRVVPDAGHLVPLSAPRAVAAAIDELYTSLAPVAGKLVNDRSLNVAGRRPGERVWGAGRELFPLVGVGTLFLLDGRADLSLVAGLARGGIDPHWPIESGRLALTVGAAMRGAAAGWSFAYLRATARLELVWRWGGGYHVDGTLLVDPRNGHVGGYGALGYTPSVVPWVRAFVGGGTLPGEGARLLVGFEIDARLNGLLY
jgi:pimeloyl-ACP methyl ester carboxylesterase